MVPASAMCMLLHAHGRCNFVFILTCVSGRCCDAGEPISVSPHIIVAGLPPQMGRGAQNRACEPLVPRARAEASERASGSVWQPQGAQSDAPG